MPTSKKQRTKKATKKKRKTKKTKAEKRVPKIVLDNMMEAGESLREEKKAKSKKKLKARKARYRDKQGPRYPKGKPTNEERRKKIGEFLADKRAAEEKKARKTHNADGKFAEGHEPYRGGGRPRGHISLRRELNVLLREIGEMPGSLEQKKTKARELLDALYRLARLGDIPAIKLCMEHNSGKPVQAVMDVTPGGPLREMTDEELANLLAESLKGGPAEPAPSDDSPENSSEESDG